MTTKQDLRRKAQEFVQDALGSAQDKRPTKKDVKHAVDQIVRNYEPVVSAPPPAQKKAVRFD